MNSRTAWMMALVVGLTSTAACRAPLPQVESLERVRMDYDVARRDATIAGHAGDELAAVAASIAEADALREARADEEAIRHKAWLAGQRLVIATLKSETREAEREIGDLEHTMRVANVELQEQATRHAAASRKLAEPPRDMHARETERGLVLTLGDVLFDIGQASLKPAARGHLQTIAAFLGAYPARTAIIEGHTDSMGRDDYNMSLSRERAFAVQSELVKLGVARSRLRIRGLGETWPVASNDDEAGRELNRRVEIVFPDGREQLSSLDLD